MARSKRRLTGGLAAVAVGTLLVISGWWWLAARHEAAASVQGELLGVTSVSSTDVWAVGHVTLAPNPAVGEQSSYDEALIEHWEGARWIRVESPSAIPGKTTATDLNAVSAVATNDVWAVGSYRVADMFSGATEAPLVEHWDGSHWTRVPSPVSAASELTGVLAVAASNVWAVGGPSWSNSTGAAFIQHWDGRRWALVRTPSIPGASRSWLKAVSGTSAVDVWAVGGSTDTKRLHGRVADRALLEHWDGRRWSVVPSPECGGLGCELSAVSAVAADDAWAVGSILVGVGFGSFYDTLIEHWDGSSWTRVPSPDPGHGLNRLTAVSGTSANDAWIVGSYDVLDPDAPPVMDAGTYFTRPLVLHWDGARWARVASPDSGADVTSLLSLSAVSGSDLWTVGTTSDSYQPGAVERPIDSTWAAHWNGYSW